MRGYVTEYQKTEQNIYRQLEIARKLQNITRKQIAHELNLSGGRITQIFTDKSMSVKQLCEVAEVLGVEIKICAKDGYC